MKDMGRLVPDPDGPPGSYVSELLSQQKGTYMWHRIGNVLKWTFGTIFVVLALCLLWSAGVWIWNNLPTIATSPATTTSAAKLAAEQQALKDENERLEIAKKRKAVAEELARLAVAEELARLNATSSSAVIVPSADYFETAASRIKAIFVCGRNPGDWYGSDGLCHVKIDWEKKLTEVARCLCEANLHWSDPEQFSMDGPSGVFTFIYSGERYRALISEKTPDSAAIEHCKNAAQH